jgi:hypothetical protein
MLLTIEFTEKRFMVVDSLYISPINRNIVYEMRKIATEIVSLYNRRRPPSAAWGLYISPSCF